MKKLLLGLILIMTTITSFALDHIGGNIILNNKQIEVTVNNYDNNLVLLIDILPYKIDYISETIIEASRLNEKVYIYYGNAMGEIKLMNDEQIAKRFWIDNFDDINSDDINCDNRSNSFLIIQTEDYILGNCIN